MDLALTTWYDHSEDLFAERHEIHIRAETLLAKQKLCERSGNNLTEATVASLSYGNKRRDAKYQRPIMGGIRERVSPHSIKLINVGQHTPLTNPGYSRQTSDGNVFNY